MSNTLIKFIAAAAVGTAVGIIVLACVALAVGAAF